MSDATRSLREDFERWMREEGYNATRHYRKPDEYAFPLANAAWKAWQEAAQRGYAAGYANGWKERAA